MKLLDNTGKELMTVSKIEADERNYLVVRGRFSGRCR